MMDIRLWVAAVLIASVGGCAPPAPVPVDDNRPEPGEGPVIGRERPLVIGVEYAFPGMAETFVEMGIRGAKYYPDALRWGAMQRGPDEPVDFAVMDGFVTEYQQAGFSELTLVLMSRSDWASVDVLFHLAPKEEYREAYKAWIRAVVERYDGDGVQDLEGLVHPVRYIEIGSEFSTYEPEPVADYLRMLEDAYGAAHEASQEVLVLHAAFLTTTAFVNDPGPDEYESAFAAVDPRVMYHSLADIRAILDRPDLFDMVNIHSIGDHREIAQMYDWLQFEMNERAYSKDIFLSDTSITPYIAWGPADSCEGSRDTLGIVVPPAAEDDRCRLAAYFTDLLNGEEQAVAWAQRIAAEDMVKKSVVAADVGLHLINTAYMEDLAWLKIPALRAGAGNAAWGGMTETTVEVTTEQRTIHGKRPSFHAIKQIASYLRDYLSVTRLTVAGEPVQTYRIEKEGGSVLVAWYEPDSPVLPGDLQPEAVLEVETNAPARVVLMAQGQEQEAEIREPVGGVVAVPVSTAPVYVEQSQGS